MPVFHFRKIPGGILIRYRNIFQIRTLSFSMLLSINKRCGCDYLVMKSIERLVSDESRVRVSNNSCPLVEMPKQKSLIFQ